MLRKGHVATDRSLGDHSGGMGQGIEFTRDRQKGGK